jgi:hypothetical protein
MLLTGYVGLFCTSSSPEIDPKNQKIPKSCRENQSGTSTNGYLQCGEVGTETYPEERLGFLSPSVAVPR